MDGSKKKTNKKLQTAVEWFTKNRNPLFLAVCLAIHGIYMGIFQILDIWQLSMLNMASCVFYANLLFFKKDTSERSMVCTYFEIIAFSVLSELALGPDYGFFLYIVGMSAAIFYLTPSYGNRRFVYQLTGIVAAVALEGAVRLLDIRFPQIQQAAQPFETLFYLVNLAITALIVLAATFL